MTHTFTPVSGAFSGTLSKGESSRPFNIPQWGIRPYWEPAANVRFDVNVWRSLGQPQVYRDQHATTQVGTDRLYVSNLHYSQTRGDNFWNGATAHVYTVTNGVRSRIAKATVTDTRVNLAVNATPTTGTPAVAGKVTTTTFQWRVESFMRPSVGYWFRVAAVDGSGNVGTYSSWVQFTAPSSGLGTGTATNTVSARGGTSTSGLSAPANVAVAAKSGEPAVAEVTWDAVGSATGYLIDVSYQDPTLNASPEYVDIDTTGLEIPAGAVVILEKTFLTQADVWASRVWNVPADSALWRLGTPGETNMAWVAYTGGDPAPSGIDAEYYWRRTMTGSGNIFPQDGEAVVHGSNHQEFYKVLEVGKTYKARFLVRANASITATFNIQNATITGSTSWALTTSFQEFEVSFSRATVLAGPGEVLSFLQFTVPSACDIEIAAFELWQDGLAKEDYSEDTKPRLPSGMIARKVSMSITKFRTPSMRQALSREGQCVRRGTIHTHLRQCQINGLVPWISLEWHLSNEEWLDFLAYMCAPVSSGHAMALLRQAQGQATPWIDVFPEFIFEFGCEPWLLSIADFWGVRAQFTDTATSTPLGLGLSAGAHFQGIINVMKTSPYWGRMDAKTTFYAGGQRTSAATIAHAANYLTASADLEATGGAGYIGGWETTNDLPDESGGTFGGILRDYASLSAEEGRVDPLNAAGASALGYESGPGYQLSGLNGATVTNAQRVLQEVALKSRAAGTANLAANAIRAAAGWNVDAFYDVEPGGNWTSHSYVHQGGGTYMQWGLLKLIYEALGRCVVRKITLSSPPVDEGVELIQAFEFKSADDYSNRIYVAVNRDIDPSLLETDDPLYNVTPSGTYAVTVLTGLASATALSYYANVGNFREHNRYPPGNRLVPASPSQTFGGMVGDPFGAADSLCVAFSYDWTSGTVPGDPSSIAINASVGAASGGLPAGNCVLIWMQGCVDA